MKIVYIKFLFFNIEINDLTLAKSKYEDIYKIDGEILVSGSDDFTLFLWKPEKNKNSIGKINYFFIKIEIILKFF